MDIMNLINTVAFPVVACLAMGYYLKYTMDVQRQDRKELEDRFNSMQKEMTDALNHNTEILTQLSERIHYIGREVGACECAD